MRREISVGQIEKIDFVHEEVVYKFQKVCTSPKTLLFDVYSNDSDSLVPWPPTPR